MCIGDKVSIRDSSILTEKQSKYRGSKGTVIDEDESEYLIKFDDGTGCWFNVGDLERLR